MRKKHQVGIVAVILCLVVASVSPVLADIQTASQIPGTEPSLSQRLEAFTARLQLAASLASVAGYALTIADVRLRTQQLVNLIEGKEGVHATKLRPQFAEYIGLLTETKQLIELFEIRLPSATAREAVCRSLEHVISYLEATLEAALEGQSQRRLALAAGHMQQADAYLATALYGNPETPEWVGVLYLPALL